MARLHFPCYIVKVTWRKKRFQLYPYFHRDVFQSYEDAYKVFTYQCNHLSGCLIELIIDYGDSREVQLKFDKRVLSHGRQ